MERHWQNRSQNDIQMQKQKEDGSGFELTIDKNWWLNSKNVGEKKNLRKRRGLGSNYEKNDHGNDQDNDGRISCHCFWKMINLFTLRLDMLSGHPRINV